jgi:hypothetical protein
MKSPRVFLVAVLVFLGGCAGGPNYYGGTSYSIPSIGGLPVSGSVGVSLSPSGVSIRPNIYASPVYSLQK